MDDLLNDYAAVAQQIADIVAGIRPGQLDSPTPCTDWTVRDVLNHTGHTARTIVSMAQGGPPADIGLPPEDRFGADPVDWWAEVTSWTIDTFADPDAMTMGLDHPTRRLDGADILVILTFDHLIHGWDLITSTGQDESSLDEASVRSVWGHVESGQMVAVQRDTGRFGPAQPDVGTTLERLLAYSGRNP